MGCRLCCGFALGTAPKSMPLTLCPALGPSHRSPDQLLRMYHFASQSPSRAYYSLFSLTCPLASGPRDSSIRWWVTKLQALDQSQPVGSQEPQAIAPLSIHPSGTGLGVPKSQESSTIPA